MDDTSPEVRQRLAELMAMRTPAERLDMALEMNQLARSQVIAGIRHDHPGTSEREFRREFFIRFYGDDFTPEQRDWFLRELDARAEAHGYGESDLTRGYRDTRAADAPRSAR